MRQSKKKQLPEPCVQFMNRRKPKLAGPVAFDKNLKYEGSLKVLHLPAMNSSVVEASTGAGKYEATQSGPGFPQP